MSAERDDHDEAGCPVGAFDAAPDTEPLDDRRPNLSGDLPTLFQGAPMFRRAVAGYDRFQVDTYVRWAEEELVTADREREHLVARHLRTRQALDEARGLLAHSAGGAEFLGLSRRIGSMLATAADEATSMRAEAEADRSAAAARAQQAAADAERLLADAEAEAALMIAETAAEADEMIAEAGRVVTDAEETARQARSEAAAQLAHAQLIEERTAKQAGLIRQHAEDGASAARLQARDEVVRLLSTGREERRRADAEASARRERLDRDAATRSAALLAEVGALEHRRSVLRAEVALLAAPVAGTTGRRLADPFRGLLPRLGWRHRSLRAP